MRLLTLVWTWACSSNLLSLSFLTCKVGLISSYMRWWAASFMYSGQAHSRHSIQDSYIDSPELSILLSLQLPSASWGHTLPLQAALPLPSPVVSWQSQHSWALLGSLVPQQCRQRLSSMSSSRLAGHTVQFLALGPLHSTQLSWHFSQLNFSPC